jgi:hypothetical protein
MKHLIIAGTAAAMLVAATGCGGSDAPRGPASYLAVSGSKVAFIQWRAASDGHLHGMITEGGVGGSGSAQKLSVTSAPFTGAMTGNSVKLTFPVLYFLRAHAHGTLNGSALTMAVPQSDGAVRQTKFSQSDKADYDRAIAALRTRIRHATVAAAKQQASGRRQSAHAQAEHSTQSSLNALYKESSLAVGGRLANGLARLAHDIEAARAHLAREKQDASGDNKYCSAAFTVTGDAEAVGGALQKAQGNVLALMPDITAVRHDVAATTAYLRHLSKAGLPAPSRASNVIASANSSLKRAIVTANAYIDQINAIDARARTLADNMATRSCSGARSGSSPLPIPPIGQTGSSQR